MSLLSLGVDNCHEREASNHDGYGTHSQNKLGCIHCYRMAINTDVVEILQARGLNNDELVK